ncbi:hypothetical protein BT96DRAFT_429651 [Gymnopus androsaceus JB14]|uniref:Uncharacterized protein n=1 Tax=Gymnopus androsaceus JB14 TaxID=1447944 RepID=A0A6A4GT76_9AGAR|nr:hypothetical protein BT96DRAFT_429651 [Gymnopus androsaceus JB14]
MKQKFSSKSLEMLRLKAKDLFKKLLHILHKEQTNPASRPTLLTVEKVHSWLPERRRLFLLINGVISVLWGIALIIFSFGVVPIAWTISQAATKPDGQYSGLTNVVINALTTLASITSHNVHCAANTQRIYLSSTAQWNHFTPMELDTGSSASIITSTILALEKGSDSETDISKDISLVFVVVDMG